MGLVSCSEAPKPAPPAAKAAVGLKVRSNPTKPMITMSDPAVDDYIVKDISDTLEAKTWRWSYDRPEVRLQLKQVADVYLSNGRFLIAHEGGIRRQVVSCNVTVLSRGQILTTLSWTRL